MSKEDTELKDYLVLKLKEVIERDDYAPQIKLEALRELAVFVSRK